MVRKVAKNAMIKNRYTQIPHPVQDTKLKRSASIKDSIKYNTSWKQGDSSFLWDGHQCILNKANKMSGSITKPTKWLVRPAKTQISLGICPVWSESSLSAWRNIGSSVNHRAHCEDSDQTGRMPRLIWVFTWRTDHFVGFVMRRLKCQGQTKRTNNDNYNKSKQKHCLGPNRGSFVKDL